EDEPTRPRGVSQSLFYVFDRLMRHFRLSLGMIPILYMVFAAWVTFQEYREWFDARVPNGIKTLKLLVVRHHLGLNGASGRLIGGYPCTSMKVNGLDRVAMELSRKAAANGGFLPGLPARSRARPAKTRRVTTLLQLEVDVDLGLDLNRLSVQHSRAINPLRYRIGGKCGEP